MGAFRRPAAAARVGAGGGAHELDVGPGVHGVLGAAVGLTFGDASFLLPVLHWINDGLLTIFFLVVGLEIKREFTVGHLASRRSAALPIAAAIGGMVVPALIYSLLIPSGQWSRGWGVPMATDTAFAVALIVMMGRRVPVELRIFLTAAAIVDDIGAIVVVALFYSGALNFLYLGGAAARRRRARAAQSGARSIVSRRIWCWAWCCGSSFMKAACTRRSPVWCSRCSFRRGRRRT